MAELFDHLPNPAIPCLYCFSGGYTALGHGQSDSIRLLKAWSGDAEGLHKKA